MSQSSRRISFSAVAVVAAVAAASYTATLAPPDGSTSTVKGTAQVDGVSASVTLTGGTPGATYPWQVHSGVCGSHGPMFGGAPGELSGRIASRTIPYTYPPITIAPDGTGQGTAKMRTPIPDTGSYYVSVQAATWNMQTIVSCGNLTKTG
jgi:superoxide dismutase, Cu-Zn family